MRDEKKQAGFISSLILHPSSLKFSRVGFEPTINGLKVRCFEPDLATDRYAILDFRFWILD
jgi:hypothetical protein